MSGYAKGTIEPPKTGILLANTGTPAAPVAGAVRRYLAQFLSDPRIVEYPRWIWLPLLYGIILVVRPRRSARLYRRIWTSEGSPLLVNTQRIATGLQAWLDDHAGQPVTVGFGMRYGVPGLGVEMRRLRDLGISRLLILPLFPQYSSATTASILDAVFAELRAWRTIPALQVIEAYYDHPAYIRALHNRVESFWQTHGAPRRLLFSFHGIPLSYNEAGDPYQEQCRWTAESIAKALSLAPDTWKVSFQSRFGPQEWLQPYTGRVLKDWGVEKLESLDVVCPGFAVDCLETLDEIGHEGRKTFQEAGGGTFRYIPALNDSSEHIQALGEIVQAELE